MKKAQKPPKRVWRGPIVEPFSFDGWELKIPPLGVAEKRAELEDQIALRCDADFRKGVLGSDERAKHYRAEAAKWRILGSIPDEQAKPIYEDCERKAKDAVDVMLALAETREGALLHLWSILFQVQSGLHALAAHGNQKAANFLVNHLYTSVDDFNLLANHKRKGKVFLPWAMKSFGIPGIITPNGEKTEDNVRLVRQLRVGEKCPISIKGKWKFQNVANAWAMRLRSHIENERTMYQIHKTISEHAGQPLPPWVEQAAKLKPFSSKTWSDWADLAWTVVMESTEQKPELNKELESLGRSAAKKKPKYCKTLKPATSASNARAKIKERLRDSFRTIANG